MPLQVKITNMKPGDNGLIVFFNLIATGNYPTGGDTIDFTQAIQDPAFVGTVAQIPASQGPISMDVWDASGNIANGFFAVQGSALNNSKMKVISAFNTELSAGAYPSPILNGKLQGQAVFNKLL